jgi:hypothetical protein
MATLRIYDPSVNLSDLVRLLAPRSLQATWTVSTVKCSEPDDGGFDASGEGGERLEALALQDARIPGSELAALATETRQVIWGEFVGSFPTKSQERWITIRSVDSTFYEITSLDDAVLNKMRSTFNDVRLAEAPFA